MSLERWKSRLIFIGVILLAVLGTGSSVVAQAPPPPPAAPLLVPATGAVLIIGGLVGYGIYRLRKRR